LELPWLPPTIPRHGPELLLTNIKEQNMLKRLLPCALALAIVGTAYAMGDERVIPLKDGASVVIFQDGKMSMRDKFGRAHAMREGTIMETVDGQKILMKGNEFWRRTDAEEINRLHPFAYAAEDER
jgi:mannose-6-phosphate isomerase class I